MSVRAKRTSAKAQEADVDDRALVDNLAQQLQARIATGELPRGSRLRQEALAEEFGVSRTPIREALRQLQTMGLVEVQPRRGAIVRGPSPRDIREAYFVRAELEGAAAQLATELITDAQLGRLREAAAEIRSVATRVRNQAGARDRQARTDTEWAAANDRFHAVILEAAGNRRLSGAVTQLHLSGAMPRDLAWAVLSQSARLLSEDADQHDAILAAIEAHKPAVARRAMHQHISRSGELAARLYECSEGGAL